MITNLKEMERLARERWAENRAFRDWLALKNPSAVNETVEKIGAEISAKIDCTACANCCRALVITVQPTDIKRLADHLDLQPYEVRQKYLRKDEEGDLVIKQRPCPFLEGNCCSVYESRPQPCRSYPHLDKTKMLGRGWNYLENTAICPIVFNTYEALKKYFGFGSSKSKSESEIQV